MDPEAIRRTVAVFLVAGAVVSSTYAFEGEAAEQMRPWMPGDKIPFAMWFGMEQKEEEADINRAAMAAALDEEEDQDLVEPPPVVAAAPDPAPGGEPVETSRLPLEGLPGEQVQEDQRPEDQLSPDPAPGPARPEAATAGLPAHAARSHAFDNASPRPEPIVIDPKEYVGLPREIEDPSGKAMDRFYEALLRTARRKPGAVTRISHWGASVIGADGLTSTARRRLQERFGSGGKGWVNITPGWGSYIQKDVVFESKGFSGSTVTTNGLRNAPKGRQGKHGYGGVAATSFGGGQATYEVFADTLELYYLAHPKGGDVKLRVDGGPWKVVSTASEEHADAWATLRAEGDGKHEFEVRAGGNGLVHLYGVTLERPGPGVVYDCITMIGTRASRLLYFEPDHLKAQVEHRKPDLQIIMYGCNELNDKRMALKPYIKEYKEVIRRLRAGAPGASCIIMTPVDHGELYRGQIRTPPLLKRLIPIQQQIAIDSGCAFYNTYEAMGGSGSAGRWFRHKPRLISGDFAHLTKAGSRALGTMVYQALMKGFAEWLEKNPHR